VGFTRAIRRDWPILLTLGVISTLTWFAMVLTAESFDVEAPPRTLTEFLLWAVITVNGWCWTAFVLFIGMRYLDFGNKWLEYGQEAVLPFFLLHQPVIMAIAFYVVQWDAGIPVKLLVVVLGSFVVTLAIYELVIRRVGPLRTLFGMKRPRGAPTDQPREKVPPSAPDVLPSP
jgi:hypothetical protein